MCASVCVCVCVCVCDDNQLHIHVHGQLTLTDAYTYIATYERNQERMSEVMNSNTLVFPVNMLNCE